MLKTLWFFLQIALIIVPASWLVSQSGTVSVEMFGYNLTIQAGIFFLLFIVFCVFLVTLYRIIRGIFFVPKNLANYKKETDRKRGYRALTLGLVALAAGDKDAASKYSRQVKKFWPNQNGLPVLLEAQIANLRGEDGLARARFKELLNDKDTAFLGIRGLLNDALDEGHYELALKYSRQAHNLHRHQPWAVKLVYDLEIKNHLWSDVLITSPKAIKSGAISKEKAISDRIAIHLMRYDYLSEKGDQAHAIKEVECAYKLNKVFVPTVIRISKLYFDLNKKRKAIKIIERAWQFMPHPELSKLWKKFEPELKKPNAEKRFKWYEGLVHLCPDHIESQILAAQAAIDIGLWGQAKSYLIAAEIIYPSTRVFQLMAIVEKNSTQNENTIHELMAKAGEALPEKVWVCKVSGLIYDAWAPLSVPHESFNTIVWDYPRAQFNSDNRLFSSNSSSLLIDPAA